MQCGAKCFLVKLEIGGKIITESVIARTPISARKTIRSTYGNEAEILTVMQKKDGDFS